MQGYARGVAPAYNVSGYPDAMAIAVELAGSKLKVGTGYASSTLYDVVANTSIYYYVGALRKGGIIAWLTDHSPVCHFSADSTA